MRRRAVRTVAEAFDFESGLLWFESRLEQFPSLLKMQDNGRQRESARVKIFPRKITIEGGARDRGYEL